MVCLELGEYKLTVRASTTVPATEAVDAELSAALNVLQALEAVAGNRLNDFIAAFRPLCVQRQMW